MNQLKAKGYDVKKGVIQDATFITSDPGHSKSDVPRGENARTRRSRDGKWAKKGNKSYFGYNAHVKKRYRVQPNREGRDDRINIMIARWICQPKMKSDMEIRDTMVLKQKATMHHEESNQGNPLSNFDKVRNKIISSKRSPGERALAS